MKVRFIGHSGFHVEDGGQQILIDPWIYGSDIAHSHLLGLLPGCVSIDFQVPPVRNKVADFAPRGILLSHFHSHHSPRREIHEWLMRSKNKVTLAYPRLPTFQQGNLTSDLKAFADIVEMKPSKNLSHFKMGSMKVSAFDHDQMDHLAWLIESKGRKVLHIADARFSAKASASSMSSRWKSYADLKPDLLFLSAGGQSMKFRSADGIPWIEENTVLSPVEAARIVALIQPRVAAVMGIYNHSLWKNQAEFALPSSAIEDEFYWAVGHLAPKTKVVKLLPGQCFILGKSPSGKKSVSLEL